MNVRINLITDATVLIVDTRLCLPTETLLKLKGMQEGILVELYYKWLRQAHHPTWVDLAAFARTT